LIMLTKMPIYQRNIRIDSGFGYTSLRSSEDNCDVGALVFIS
jgi:hypothetical protein